jgi:hypothetical protein
MNSSPFFTYQQARNNVYNTRSGLQPATAGCSLSLPHVSSHVGIYFTPRVAAGSLALLDLTLPVDPSLKDLILGFSSLGGQCGSS